MQFIVDGAGNGTTTVDLSLCKFAPKSLAALCLFARNRVICIGVYREGVRFKFSEPHTVSVWLHADYNTEVFARFGIDTTPYIRLVNDVVNENWDDISSDIKECGVDYGE